jgi:hypothetical protein
MGYRKCSLQVQEHARVVSVGWLGPGLDTRTFDSFVKVLPDGLSRDEAQDEPFLRGSFLYGSRPCETLGA